MAWMVPTIAADYLGWGVEEVLSAVRGGKMPSRVEGGFLLVGVGEEAEPLPLAPEAAGLRPMGDWREGRQTAMTLRIAPVRQAA